MPMSFKSGGWQEMQGEIELLRETAENDAIRAGVRAGANVIRDEMETLAPILDEKTARSTALDPGTIKANLVVSMRRPKNGERIAIIGPRKLIAHVVRWVEYGHRLVRGGYSKSTVGGFQGPGRQIGEVAAHPFLRPAFTTSRQRAFSAFVEELRAQLRKWVS